MTLSLPRNHTIASLSKLNALWLDLSAADIPAAWEETTGERIVLYGATVRA